ncbi:MAG TPA: hypothetical protein VF142_18065 [Longimicrobium sp.]
MKYDDASWHAGGRGFPSTSPMEFGGTHIALMLKWCFQKGWVGELHRDEDTAEHLDRLLRGELSATEYFFTWCDGKFTDEDLSDESNAFVLHYYDGPYGRDFEENFGPLYVRSEAEHDFGKFAEMVEARYQEFLRARDAANAALADENRTEPAKRPWWRFW